MFECSICGKGVSLLGVLSQPELEHRGSLGRAGVSDAWEVLRALGAVV